MKTDTPNDLQVMRNEQNVKPVVIIEEGPDIVPGQGEGETPVITIERDEPAGESAVTVTRPRRRWPWFVAGAVLAALLCLAAVVGYKYYRSHIRVSVPVSVTSKENIAKLQTVADDAIQPAVVVTSDTILGVALRFYELRGLQGEIVFEEPRREDPDVYLYSRCADQTSYDPATNRYLGSLVADGKLLESDHSRLGYCAMANGNIVIGIARDEKVRNYCVQAGGAFFRQFILVSDGVIPTRFYLHGKVERRGLGRIGDKLYYLETLHKETMWDFADALREYGFTDAIYITGGDDCSFYRTADGVPHTLGNPTRYDGEHKGSGIVPWVVFRKR